MTDIRCPECGDWQPEAEYPDCFADAAKIDGLPTELGQRCGSCGNCINLAEAEVR